MFLSADVVKAVVLTTSEVAGFFFPYIFRGFLIAVACYRGRLPSSTSASASFAICNL